MPYTQDSERLSRMVRLGFNSSAGSDACTQCGAQEALWHRRWCRAGAACGGPRVLSGKGGLTHAPLALGGLAGVVCILAQLGWWGHAPTPMAAWWVVATHCWLGRHGRHGRPSWWMRLARWSARAAARSVGCSRRFARGASGRSVGGPGFGRSGAGFLSDCDYVRAGKKAATSPSG